MKSLFTNSKYFILMLFSCALLCSCQKKDNHATASEIPQLLPRSEKIQLGKEWDFVQNIYAQQIKALNKNDKDVEAKLYLAQLYVKEARVTGEHGYYYPAALNITEQILATQPLATDVKFRALLTKAGVQLSLHEFEKALETGQKAVALNSKNAQAYGVLVDAYVELGAYDKAVESADMMIQIKPDIRSYSRVSYLREIHGDYDGAIEAMTLAVKAGYPGYEETAWAMQTLGELYMRYGENEKAESVFKTNLSEREDYPFSVASLGELKFHQKDFADSEIITKDAISIIPEVGFYVQLANIYKEAGRATELEEIVQEIFVMLEDDVVHGHNMNLEYADIYLNLLEDTDAAMKYALLEYAKRPKNIDVNRILADITYNGGEIEKAQAYITAASMTNSIHPDLIRLKGLTASNQQISSL